MKLHHQLNHRIDINGELVTDTGLHIGSGDREGSDASILRSLHGWPYIPGSSLKGVLRARVESVAHLFGHHPCFLRKTEGENCKCLSQRKKGPEDIQKKAKEFADNPTALADFLCSNLCIACRLFGGASWRSRLCFADLHPVDGDVPTERRDGVGIDRDSRRAVDNVKYGFQTVPPLTRFHFRLTAENLDADERLLLVVAISELVHGHVSLGGKTSRGLGSCHLDLERTTVRETHFGDRSAFLRFFTQSRAQEQQPLAAWLEAAEPTITLGEGTHA